MYKESNPKRIYSSLKMQKRVCKCAKQKLVINWELCVHNGTAGGDTDLKGICINNLFQKKNCLMILDQHLMKSLSC